MNKSVPLKKKIRIYIGSVVGFGKRLIPLADNGFRVLVYHSITDKVITNEWEESTTPKDLFVRQMEYLADNKYNIISCKQGIEYMTSRLKIPSRTVAISFDDGYRNNYINALPALKKYNFCATIFITVNFLRDYSSNPQYLSCSELLDIKKSGIIDFGSHSFSHRTLTMLDKPELDKEIRQAKQKLEDIVDDKIDLFAYPFGHSKSYDRKVVEAIRSAGFTGAYTTIFGLNDFRSDPFLIRRHRISWLDELDEFEKHLSGAYDWCALCESFRYKRSRSLRDQYAK